MQQSNQRVDASMRDRISELQAANQLGLDTLREFWGNPDIRLGFKAWWISISSFEERLHMIEEAYNAAQIKKSDDDDAEEDFLQLNEQAAYRIQLMVTQELQDLPSLAKLGETGDGVLIDILEALVDGRENAALLAPLQPPLKRQIDEELGAEIRLLTQLSRDVQRNHLLTDAIFDRLEQRFRNYHLSAVPYLLRLRIQHLAALDPSSKRSTADIEFITQLILECIPHTRTFALARFFAYLINEFIQVIMSPTKDSRNLDVSFICDFCGETKPSIKKCARCHLRQYCGKECQASHWRLIHKDECVALAVQRDSRKSDGSKEA